MRSKNVTIDVKKIVKELIALGNKSMMNKMDNYSFHFDEYETLDLLS